MTPDDFKGVKEDLHKMDKRLDLLAQRVDQIDSNVQKIADVLGWFTKIVGAAVITAVVTWILQGGLTGG